MQAYNPRYDPLVDKTPGNGRAYAPSYWVASAGKPPACESPVNADCEADVAIIGGGFTGLATALFLAKNHNIKATVLEANQVGWGCTSRNGGQAHLMWGRLSRSQWIKRWGVDTAVRLHHNTLAGFSLFRSLLDDIDCQQHGSGNLLIAHAPSALKKLARESEICNRVFGYDTKIISRDVVRDDYLNDAESCGALLEPEGIALHPLKLAFGYLKMARKYGAKVHPGKPGHQLA